MWILKVSPKYTKFLRSLPLHHSQKEVETNEDFSIFTYQLCIERDFISEILSNGTDIEVLEPQLLREEVSATIRKMLGKYELWRPSLVNRPTLASTGNTFTYLCFFGVFPVCFLKNCTKAEGLEKFSSSDICCTVRFVVRRSIFASINTASWIHSNNGLPVMRFIAVDRYLGVRLSFSA